MELKTSAAWLATFEEDEPAGFATLADRIELEKRQLRTVTVPNDQVLVTRTKKVRVAKMPQRTNAG